MASRRRRGWRSAASPTVTVTAARASPGRTTRRWRSRRGGAPLPAATGPATTPSTSAALDTAGAHRPGPGLQPDPQLPALRSGAVYDRRPGAAAGHARPPLRDVRYVLVSLAERRWPVWNR